MARPKLAETRQLNVRLPPATQAQLAALAAAGHGTQTDIVIKAIDRLAQTELASRDRAARPAGAPRAPGEGD